MLDFQATNAVGMRVQSVMKIDGLQNRMTSRNRTLSQEDTRVVKSIYFDSLFPLPLLTAKYPYNNKLDKKYTFEYNNRDVHVCAVLKETARILVIHGKVISDRIKFIDDKVHYKLLTHEPTILHLQY